MLRVRLPCGELLRVVGRGSLAQELHQGQMRKALMPGSGSLASVSRGEAMQDFKKHNEMGPGQQWGP